MPTKLQYKKYTQGTFLCNQWAEKSMLSEIGVTFLGNIDNNSQQFNVY